MPAPRPLGRPRSWLGRVQAVALCITHGCPSLLFTQTPLFTTLFSRCRFPCQNKLGLHLQETREGDGGPTAFHPLRAVQGLKNQVY